MKKSFLLTLVVGLMVTTSAMAQDWVRVYTSNGRSVEIPEGWTSEETVRNGIRQLVATNPSGRVNMAIFFYENSGSAGDRMQEMISHNNVDVVESFTETFGSLRVMTKKGKMNYNGTNYKCYIATSDGAGQQWNVVGALWGEDDAFQKQKDKFEPFFTSLQ